MKKPIVVLVCFLVIVAIAVLGITVKSDVELASRILADTDPSALLAACRTMIMEMDDYKSLSNVRTPFDEFEITFRAENQPIPERVPLIVRNLQPLVIIIRRDEVRLRLNVPRRRIYIIAFGDRVEEFGTKKVVNGLWFWNGRLESKAME